MKKELVRMLKAILYSIKRRIFWAKVNGGLKENEAKTEPEKYADEVYYYIYGKHVNRQNPVLLDEKLTILKTGLYLNNGLIIKCADKYRVREYVEECGLQHILNKLYGMWTDYKDIDISKLPNSFVLKRNNDAGGC